MERLQNILDSIKKETSHKSDYLVSKGVAQFGGMTKDYFVVGINESYGESHYRLYRIYSNQLDYKKVSGRYQYFMTETKLFKLMKEFEMENFELVEESRTFFNKNKFR